MFENMIELIQYNGNTFLEVLLNHYEWTDENLSQKSI